tara:strand:+ start:481 stop:651 length:171 start_codon:yes stop_codon:yes gene_type:complete
MKNIKKIVYHLNNTSPLVIDMKIIIKKKTNPSIITNKIMPSYDESIIEKIYKNGGL